MMANMMMGHQKQNWGTTGELNLNLRLTYKDLLRQVTGIIIINLLTLINLIDLCRSSTHQIKNYLDI